MKVIYSEFDFNRKEEFQLIKKLYLDNDKVFWRITPNKKSQEYFYSLKDLKSFPDAQVLDINDNYIDFKYDILFSDFNIKNNAELFNDFIQRNFEIITVDTYDFSSCNFLAGLQINGSTKLVLNSYLSLNPEQVCRTSSKMFLNSIYEFPCKAIPLELLEVGILSNGTTLPELKVKNFSKTPIYNICRYNYFSKYKKDSIIFNRKF